MKWLYLITLFFTFSLQAAETKNAVQEDSSLEKKEKNGNGDDEKKEDQDKKDDKDDKDDDDKPIKIGNFSLRSSQQPSPLIGFGEKVLDKGTVQLQFLSLSYWGQNRHIVEQFSTIVYGVTDQLSVLLQVPFAIESKIDEFSTWGIEDIYVVVEYAFYTKSRKYSSEQATILGSIFFPTGDDESNPQLGFGTPSIFFGATYMYTGIYWFASGGVGAFFNEPKDRLKHGDIYYYQFCLGRNFWTPPCWIYAWMVELNGSYSKNDVFDGFDIPDSGGNIIYLTPSLWISSHHFGFQAGVGYAIQQSLNGNQNRQNYLTAAQISWTF